MRFIGLSTSEVSQIFLCGLLSRWIAICLMWKSAYRISHHSVWNKTSTSKYLNQSDLLLYPLLPEYSLQNSNSAFRPVLTSYVNNVYGFTDHHIYPVKTVYRKESNISSDLFTVKQVIWLINFFLTYIVYSKIPLVCVCVNPLYQ
ncbi:UNVERIFIED_CONTAM: Ino80 [Trichonephila clavipes]